MKTVLCGTPSSVESRSVAKSLFNSLEVVSFPALFCSLLLVVRDASTLHLQLRLAAPVKECQRNRWVMLWEEERRRHVTIIIITIIIL